MAPDVQVVAPPQEPLVLALAQAQHWQDMLDAGKFDTVEALAKRMKVSTHLRRAHPAPESTWPPTSSRPSSTAANRAGYR